MAPLLSSPPRRACCPPAACLHLSLRPLLPPSSSTAPRMTAVSLLLTPPQDTLEVFHTCTAPHGIPTPRPQGGCRDQLFQTLRGGSWGFPPPGSSKSTAPAPSSHRSLGHLPCHLVFTRAPGGEPRLGQSKYLSSTPGWGLHGREGACFCGLAALAVCPGHCEVPTVVQGVTRSQATPLTRRLNHYQRLDRGTEILCLVVLQSQ